MLRIKYDIREGDFGRVMEQIAEHLTPKKEEDKQSLATICELPDVRKSLTANANPRVAKFDWWNCVHYAQDLGLFSGIENCNYEELSKLMATRYRIPRDPGSTTLHRTEFYGDGLLKEPMLVAMQEDGRTYCNPVLWALNRLVDEKGFDKAWDEIATRQEELCKEGLFKSTLLPCSKKELEAMLKKENEQNYAQGMITDINMIRFFWDFIGRGIAKAGYLPKSIEGQIYASNQPQLAKDLDAITGYPTLEPLEAAKIVLGEWQRG